MTGTGFEPERRNVFGIFSGLGIFFKKIYFWENLSFFPDIFWKFRRKTGCSTGFSDGGPEGELNKECLFRESIITLRDLRRAAFHPTYFSVGDPFHGPESGSPK